MFKNVLKVCLTVVFVFVLSVAVCAAYPSSGKQAPDGSVLIEGKIIGEKFGWGGNEWAGCAAAFDGNTDTFYDPTNGADTNCYTGMKLKESYVLTMVCIMPRWDFPDRFDGAMIQGSNDGEKWTTLWQSSSGLDMAEWQVIKKFKNNTGYTYYRYCNDRSHGDVAEVELYGYAGTSDGLSTVNSVPVGSVTLTFDSCGGEGEGFEAMEATFGENYPSITYVPEKEGYFFDGWYTSPVNGVKVNAEKKVTNPSSHTLYAHWSTEMEEKTESAESSDIPNENEPESGHELTEIQGICLTVSLVFILAAAVSVIAKKKA